MKHSGTWKILSSVGWATLKVRVALGTIGSLLVVEDLLKETLTQVHLTTSLVGMKTQKSSTSWLRKQFQIVLKNSIAIARA
jgi:hypothetical protein